MPNRVQLVDPTNGSIYSVDEGESDAAQRTRGLVPATSEQVEKFKKDEIYRAKSRGERLAETGQAAVEGLMQSGREIGKLRVDDSGLAQSLFPGQAPAVSGAIQQHQATRDKLLADPGVAERAERHPLAHTLGVDAPALFVSGGIGGLGGLALESVGVGALEEAVGSTTEGRDFDIGNAANIATQDLVFSGLAHAATQVAKRVGNLLMFGTGNTMANNVKRGLDETSGPVVPDDVRFDMPLLEAETRTRRTAAAASSGMPPGPERDEMLRRAAPDLNERVKTEGGAIVDSALETARASASVSEEAIQRRISELLPKTSPAQTAWSAKATERLDRAREALSLGADEPVAAPFVSRAVAAADEAIRAIDGSAEAAEWFRASAKASEQLDALADDLVATSLPAGSVVEKAIGDIRKFINKSLSDRTLFGQAAEMHASLRGPVADKIQAASRLTGGDLKKRLADFVAAPVASRAKLRLPLDQVIEGLEELAQAHERFGTALPKQIEDMRERASKLRKGLALADDIQSAVKNKPVDATFVDDEAVSGIRDDVMGAVEEEVARAGKNMAADKLAEVVATRMSAAMATAGAGIGGSVAGGVGAMAGGAIGRALGKRYGKAAAKSILESAAKFAKKHGHEMAAAGLFAAAASSDDDSGASMAGAGGLAALLGGGRLVRGATKFAPEAARAAESVLRGKSLRDLGAFENSMRPESIERLRKDTNFLETGTVLDHAGKPDEGMVIGLYPEGAKLTNGRHRLQVARENGMPSVEGTIRQYGNRGGITWEYHGPINVSGKPMGDAVDPRQLGTIPPKGKAKRADGPIAAKPERDVTPTNFYPNSNAARNEYGENMRPYREAQRADNTRMAQLAKDYGLAGAGVGAAAMSDDESGAAMAGAGLLAIPLFRRGGKTLGLLDGLRELDAKLKPLRKGNYVPYKDKERVLSEMFGDANGEAARLADESLDRLEREGVDLNATGAEASVERTLKSSYQQNPGREELSFEKRVQKAAKVGDDAPTSAETAGEFDHMVSEMQQPPNMKEALASMRNSVSKEGRADFKYYQGGMGFRMNEVLRGASRTGGMAEEIAKGKAQDVIGYMTQAIEDGATAPGLVTRGVKLSEEEIQKLKSARVLTAQGIMSTSPKPNVAKRFATASDEAEMASARRVTGNKPVLFEVEQATGVPLSADEVAMRPGTQFKVIGMTERNFGSAKSPNVVPVFRVREIGYKPGAKSDAIIAGGLLALGAGGATLSYSGDASAAEPQAPKPDDRTVAANRILAIDQAATQRIKHTARVLAGLAEPPDPEGLTTALGRFGAEHDDPRAAFEERKQILQKAEISPALVYDVIGASLGDVASVSPELYQATASRILDNFRYLRENLPTEVKNSLLYPTGLPPSESALRDWATQWSTVMDPESVLDDIDNGTVTHLQIQTLQGAHPDTYQQLRTEIISEVGANFASIPTATKLQLDILFQADGLAGPMFSSEAAAIIGEASAAASQRKQPGPADSGSGAEETASGPSGLEAIRTSVTNRGV